MRIEHVGIFYDGRSRPLPSIEASIPRDVRLAIEVQPSALIVGSIGVAKITVENIGRSRASNVAVRIDTEDGLRAVPSESSPTDGPQTIVLGRLEVGERHGFMVPLAAPMVTERAVKQLVTTATADGNVHVSAEASVEILAPHLLRVDLEREVEARWELGVPVSSAVVVRNEGPGVARRIEILSWTDGGVRVAFGDAAVTRTIRNGRRVCRWLIEELAPDAVATFPATITAVNAEDLERRVVVEAIAEESEQAVRCELSIDAGAGSFFGPRTRVLACADLGSVGELVSVPIEVENGSPVPMHGVLLFCSLPPSLVLEGVEAPSASIQEDVVFLGTLAAGAILQANLLLRVGALERGSHELPVNAEVTAFNAYGRALDPGVVRAEAVSVIDVALRAGVGGMVIGTVANVGDATEPEVIVRVELESGMVLHGTTSVGGRVLADTNGASPVIGGVRLRDVEAGAQVDFQFRVLTDGQHEAVIRLVAQMGEQVRSSGTVRTLGALMMDTTDFGRANGFIVEAAVLALPSSSASSEPPAEAPDAFAVASAHEDSGTGSGAVRSAEDEPVSAVAPSEPAPAAPTHASDDAALEEPAPALAAQPGDGEPEVPVVAAAEAGLQEPAAAPEPAAIPNAVEHHGDEDSPLHPDTAAAIASTARTPLNAADQPLREIPFALDVTSTWLRGITVSLESLVQSPCRDVSMHALALRFFVPDRILATAHDEASEQVLTALGALAARGRSEALRCSTMAGAGSFRVTDSWLRMVEPEGLRDEAERFVETLTSTSYAPSDGGVPAESLVSAVDTTYLRSNVGRRFTHSDTTATTWLFLTLLPTTIVASPALSGALLAYRKAFEALLFDVGVNENVLVRPAPQELDDALTLILDELRAYAPARVAAA